MSSPFANPFGGNDPSRLGPGVSMQSVMEEDESELMASPTSPGFGQGGNAMFNSSSFSPDDNNSSFSPGPRSPPNPESYPAQYNFGRRTSVSAESLKPSADTADNWTPPFHEKTQDQLVRLKAALKENFLFAHLDDEQYSQVLGALVEKPIPAKDIKVGRLVNWWRADCCFGSRS